MKLRHLLFVGVLGLVACGESSAPSASSGPTPAAGVNIGAASTQVVASDALAFSPNSVTVHPGDIVQWTDSGTVSHTVTFDSQPQLSDVSLVPGGAWEVRFTAAGTFAYHCTIHSGMNGTVVVK